MWPATLTLMAVVASVAILFARLACVAAIVGGLVYNNPEPLQSQYVFVCEGVLTGTNVEKDTFDIFTDSFDVLSLCRVSSSANTKHLTSDIPTSPPRVRCIAPLQIFQWPATIPPSWLPRWLPSLQPPVSFRLHLRRRRLPRRRRRSRQLPPPPRRPRRRGEDYWEARPLPT